MPNKWLGGIDFISTAHDHEPPDFRSTWRPFLKNNNKKRFLTLQSDLVRAVGVASRDYDPTQPLGPSSPDPTPFWWLLVHLEMLILAPTAQHDRDGDSIAKTITERIEAFRRGDIKSLYDAAMQISSWSKPTHVQIAREIVLPRLWPTLTTSARQSND